jgi:hypothetical protein
MFANNPSYFEYTAPLRYHQTNPNPQFVKTLIEESSKKCKDYLNTTELGSFGICQKNLMIAASCVTLRKANSSMGDLRGHIYDCKYEIDLVKENLNKNFSNFPIKRFDKWLQNLSLNIYSFA